MHTELLESLRSPRLSGHLRLHNYDWAILNASKWLSPESDNPRTATTFHDGFQQTRFNDSIVLKAGRLVGRGRKP